MLDGIKKLQGRMVKWNRCALSVSIILGLIASVIKDLELIDMIDRRLVPDEQERITPGEAAAWVYPLRPGLRQSALIVNATVLCQ